MTDSPAAPPPPKEHRWFAWMWERVMSGSGRMRAWREATAGHARGRVLEIGIGNGMTIPFYHDIDELIGVEPDGAMRRYLEPRAAGAPFPVRVLAVSGERLPIDDASIDTVVSNLVYCTIPDVAASLAEVRRVLKPGGEFRFVEHVRGGRFAGPIHDFITPVWRWTGAGCHPNRRIEDAIRAAGFDIVEIERGGGPIPHIVGVARAAA